jgi:hypothetical protein
MGDGVSVDLPFLETHMEKVVAAMFEIIED